MILFLLITLLFLRMAINDTKKEMYKKYGYNTYKKTKEYKKTLRSNICMYCIVLNFICIAVLYFIIGFSTSLYVHCSNKYNVVTTDINEIKSLIDTIDIDTDLGIQLSKDDSTVLKYSNYKQPAIYRAIIYLPDSLSNITAELYVPLR